jgi:homogentisate 1,2-dioxygenase
MNKVDHKQVSGDGGKPLSNELQYMPGFGNDFETEVLPGALPQGMNSPQKCAYGLYGEQLSGTAFTAPSHQNERTWCYRIRPSVKHTSRFQKIDLPYWKSAPNVCEDVISLGQYRWDPVPHADEGLNWLTGMRYNDDGRGCEHPGRHGNAYLPCDEVDGR